MAKKITITVRNWVFDTYLDQKTDNRSAFIEELIVLGSEAQLKEEKGLKQRFLLIFAENQKLQLENSRLSFELGKYKSEYMEKKREKERKREAKEQEREFQKQREKQQQIKDAITRGMRL